MHHSHYRSGVRARFEGCSVHGRRTEPALQAVLEEYAFAIAFVLDKPEFGEAWRVTYAGEAQGSRSGHKLVNVSEKVQDVFS